MTRLIHALLGAAAGWVIGALVGYALGWRNPEIIDAAAVFLLPVLWLWSYGRKAQ